jgi:hypothetical protein
MKKERKENFYDHFVYTHRDIRDSLQFRINCDFFSSEKTHFLGKTREIEKKREEN